jgi:hypothetical protein
MTESINAPNNVETVVNIPRRFGIKCKKCVVDGYDYRPFNYDPAYICNDDCKTDCIVRLFFLIER